MSFFENKKISLSMFFKIIWDFLATNEEETRDTQMFSATTFEKDWWQALSKSYWIECLRSNSVGH